MMKCHEIAEEYEFFRDYGMPHDRAIETLADAYELPGENIRRHLKRAKQQVVMA